MIVFYDTRLFIIEEVYTGEKYALIGPSACSVSLNCFASKYGKLHLKTFAHASSENGIWITCRPSNTSRKISAIVWTKYSSFRQILIEADQSRIKYPPVIPPDKIIAIQSVSGSMDSEFYIFTHSTHRHGAEAVFQARKLPPPTLTPEEQFEIYKAEELKRIARRKRRAEL